MVLDSVMIAGVGDILCVYAWAVLVGHHPVFEGVGVVTRNLSRDGLAPFAVAVFGFSLSRLEPRLVTKTQGVVRTTHRIWGAC